MANALSRFWSWLGRMGGYSEEHFVSSPGDPHRARFDAYAARLDRYDVWWSHYEGNVYRKIHRFSEALRQEYDLYPAIRTVYSPAYRGIEFWAEHIMAGILDPEAGDGQERPSAIPIRVRQGHPKEKPLRESVAQLWRDSVWQVHKDNWTRFGAALGDVGLLVFDDPARQKVFLRVIHPGIVKEVDVDPQGNCKGYVFEEWRPDPREGDALATPRLVRYNEVASRVGERVHFETFLEGESFDWRDYEDGDRPVGSAWTEDYGFIPFVWHQHRNMGLGAGWAEFHPSLSKLQELDDLASKTIDQVRKLVDSPWLITGVADAGDLKVSYGDGEADDDDGKARRNRTPLFTAADPAVRAQALVGNLDLKAAAEQARSILDAIERDHPELRDDDANVSGSASGRARRIARERIEARVAARRAGYDDALVRAHMMAISIGAMKGYPGYEAFDADSYGRGELDHSIGDRPVFTLDTMDDIEEGTAFWAMAKAAVDAGMPLEVFLRREGWSDEDIAEIAEARDGEEQKAIDRVQQRMKAAGAGPVGADTADATTGDATPGYEPMDDSLFQLDSGNNAA